MSPRVLLVEDEPHIALGIRVNLELDGYQVVVAPTIADARTALGSTFDAIVLDVMLPDGSGFDLCAERRAAGDYTPVLMVTARADPADRVRGLEVGADDYLPKPFDLDELRARVRSLLRRHQWSSQAPAEAERLRFGAAEVDFEAFTASVAGAPVSCTELEFDLLRYFAQNADRVVSRRALLEHVWKLANHPNTRVVDNFLARLRKHFEPDPSAPVHFVSVRGAGYKFVPQP